MSNVPLQLFCNRIVGAGTLTRADVRQLTVELLPDGITNRDEADLLLALDRAVPSDPSFAHFLIAEVVDYVVWIERPTGTVDGELSAWLTTSIAGRSGPTQTGARIAREVICEADSTDEALIAFALEANGWTHRKAGEAAAHLAKAA